MKAKNFLISVGISLGFALVVLLLLYPSGSPLGDFFDVFFVLIVTHYVVIGFAGLALVLRVVRVIKGNGSLFYILIGTFNIFLAIVGFTLFINDQADMDWLHKCIGNLLVGFILLADTFVLFPMKR